MGSEAMGFERHTNSEKSGTAPIGPAFAIDRWENDGGATIQGMSHPAELVDHDLTVAERLLLHRLGVAVLSQWNDLPVSVQRNLFRAASENGTSRTFDIPAQLARFLHAHKDDDVFSAETDAQD